MLAPVDAPLGEASERYAILIEGISGTIERDETSPEVAIPNGDLATLGSGPATITVRQVGDWANSRPVATVVYLP